MMWLAQPLLFVSYTGLSAYVFYFCKHQAGVAYPQNRERIFLSVLLLIHSVWLYALLFQNQTIHMGFGHALNLVSWLMLILYWVAGIFYRVQGLQLLLFPLAALTLIFAYFFPGQNTSYPLNNCLFMVHILASVLAYSLFSIATLFALLMWRLVRDLHQKKVSPLVQFLPPLLSLEKLMFQTLWVGFILLTFSVVSGTFFSEVVFNRAFDWNHKSIFGILSWLIYAVLLFGRYAYRWRGRLAIRWVLIGFCCLMLAYIGSKFILEVILK